MLHADPPGPLRLTPDPALPPSADELRVRSWVSQATLHRKLGDSEAAVRLLRKAARAEPKVG